MLLKDEKGQALYMSAMAMLVLMGFLGLGIDMGVLRYEKRLQQSAADAAAIAGASNLAYGGYATGAQKASAENGFQDNGGGNSALCSPGGAGNPPAGTPTSTAPVGTICVQVNNPPASGPHSAGANSGSYVEVLVSAVQPTYFMPVVGFTKSTVTARAVAGNLAPAFGGACLYTLNPDTVGIQGININGTGKTIKLDAPNCGVVDNGDFSDQAGNNKINVNAAYVGVSGNVQDKSNVTCTDGQTGAECPSQGSPPVANPLAYLTPPCSGTACGGNAWDGNNTIFPNHYSGTMSLGPGTWTFEPGLYVFDGGGLSIGANATVTGTGVTFYFTNGATVTATGTPLIQFEACGGTISCTSGAMPGVLFYQDPTPPYNSPGPSLGGNSGSYFDGALYFPNSPVTFFGNGQAISVAIVVAGEVLLSGTPSITLTGTSGLPPGENLIMNSALVE
jgi:hypothetical protein